MALEINQNRTFKVPVTVSMLNEDGKETNGKFNAVFKNLKISDIEKQERLLDIVLISADIVIRDDDGHALEGDDLINEIKDDMDLAQACIEAFNTALEKKSKKKTLDKSSDTSSTEVVTAEPVRKK